MIGPGDAEVEIAFTGVGGDDGAWLWERFVQTTNYITP